MLPLGLGNFVSSRSGERQPHDSIGRSLILVDGDRIDEPLCLVPAQKPIALCLLAELNATRRITRNSRDFPLDGKIVQVAQYHDDAVGSAGCISLLPHL